MVGLVDEAVGEFDFVVIFNRESSFKLNPGGKGFDDGGLMGFGFTELEGVIFLEPSDAFVNEGRLVGEGERDGLAFGAVFSVIIIERNGCDTSTTGAERELKLVVFERDCLFGEDRFLRGWVFSGYWCGSGADGCGSCGRGSGCYG